MAIVRKHEVGDEQTHRCIRALSAWWRGGAAPPRRWVIYFYYHMTLTLLLGVGAFLDSRRWYPEISITHQAFLVRVAVYCTLGMLVWQAVLLPAIAPFLSARLLWLARKGGPSFIALALCDTVATLVQHLALLIGYG